MRNIFARQHEFLGDKKRGLRLDNNYVISIIIPVYNTEKTLPKCIESLICQSLMDNAVMEIILVDDGSTDHSGVLCDKYAEKYPSIKVVHKENGRQISARIAGLKMATADCIGFVDSDDYVEPTMFERLFTIFKETGCDLVSSGIIRDFETTGNCEIVYDNFKENLYVGLELKKYIFPTILFDFDKNDFGLYCTLVNKLFKKEKLMQVFEDIDTNIFYGEDSAILYPYCLLCDSIYILHEALYHYRIHAGSMCSSVNTALPENTYRLYKVLKEAFSSHECHYMLMRQLKRYILDIEVHSLELLFDMNPGVLNRWEFDYPEELFRQKYVIYGAGGCGQALYHFLRRNRLERNLVAWIDKYPDRVQNQCDYPIVNIPEGLKKEHCNIILAIKKKQTADKVAQELVNTYGEETNRIVWREMKENSFFSETLY